ncbi:hypothetical protein HMJ29_15625 [Hymenobacter taeanensis]|uniref:DUF4177 domain-containing protein n=1 Tax=Hymenobacter taeanensis TaxID=2735321 RepID=A0A6M6BJY6_9BACT|nr:MULTISPECIES: hypothetical protein [Hymenobacter]QJX48279.1 hypothetical protein HMJ29_15625 [Hymenobacter taeanensis]UOQ82238.1 hypothetical protein MUN83_05570 [Hymenobacter sp. 5414T-23]
MKKLFYMVGCWLVLSSSSALAQGEQPRVIVVRTVESVNKFYIYTSRGEEKAARQEFKFKFGDTYEQATPQYQKIIATYIEQGYVLQSSTALDKTNPNNMFIFIKAPKL